MRLVATKKTLALIAGLAAVFVAALAAGQWLGDNILGGNAGSGGEVAPVVTPATAAKGDIGFREPNTGVEVGSSDVQAGAFERVDGGEIFVSSGNMHLRIPLSADEVVVMCTTQHLAGISRLNFDQVTAVLSLPPDQVGGAISAGTPVVVLSDASHGTRIAHTIAVSDPAICSH